MALSGTQAQPLFAETGRRDAWWLQSVATFAGLGAFIVYSTWAAFQGNHYHFGSYLSPFYSPELFGDSPHSWFGPKPGFWPAWLPFSPALLILWAPGGFRFTCYYYRGAYYKAFWADPPACAVGEPRKSYLGENSLPLIMQNLHRYFLYLALVFLVLLWSDVWKSLWWGDAKEFHLGLGSIILAVNTFLLSGYALGCHSLRHIVGGVMDIMSKAPARKKCYDCVSCLNKKHMAWAWCSLFSVGFSDLYVRMLSMGVWHDVRFF